MFVCGVKCQLTNSIGNFFVAVVNNNCRRNRSSIFFKMKAFDEMLEITKLQSDMPAKIKDKAI